MVGEADCRVELGFGCDFEFEFECRVECHNKEAEVRVQNLEEDP